MRPKRVGACRLDAGREDLLLLRGRVCHGAMALLVTLLLCAIPLLSYRLLPSRGANAGECRRE